MNGVIRGVDGQRAALDVQKLLGVDGVVDGCIDIQRQIADGQRRFAVLIRRRAGFDAVFAVGRDGQLSIAAEGDKQAILTLNDGVFGIFVFGVVVVIVLLGIAQGIFRTVGNKEVTSLDLPQVMAAVFSLVSVRPSSTSVTPVVLFFTLMEPSAQLPETV